MACVCVCVDRSHVVVVIVCVCVCSAAHEYYDGVFVSAAASAAGKRVIETALQRRHIVMIDNDSRGCRVRMYHRCKNVEKLNNIHFFFFYYEYFLFFELVDYKSNA